MMRHRCNRGIGIGNMNDTETDERELLSEAHIEFLKHQTELEELRAERVLQC